MKNDFYFTPVIVLLFFICVANADDLSSENTENRFHQIYKKYNQQPTDREAWDQVLTSQVTRIYEVQDKDTLWDVSKTLFADSSFWPKIWAQNTLSIDNPHEIDPQMEIEFYPGTFNDAPSIAFVHVQSKEDRSKKERVKILIPPPHVKPEKLVRQLPDSLPLYQYTQSPIPKKEWKISSRQWGRDRVQQYLSQFVTEKLSGSIGRVISTELGTMSAHQFQYVYIQLSKPGVKKVKLMQVSDRITNFAKNQSIANGQIIQVQGELEVVEELVGRPGIYKALVVHELNPILVGASIFEGELQSFNIRSESPAIQSMGAEIIGGPLAQKTRLGQIEDYLYLGSGSVQGLEVGQILNVYSRAKAYSLIGKVQVVHVAAGLSTAFILQQNDVIEIGDYVGGEKEGGRPFVLTPIEKVQIGNNQGRIENNNENFEDEVSTDEFNFADPAAEPSDKNQNQSSEEDFDQLEQSTDQLEQSTDQLEQSADQLEQSTDQLEQSTDQLEQSTDQAKQVPDSGLNQNEVVPPPRQNKKEQGENFEEELLQNDELEFEEDSTGEELSRENETPQNVPAEVDMSGDQQ